MQLTGKGDRAVGFATINCGYRQLLGQQRKLRRCLLDGGLEFLQFRQPALLAEDQVDVFFNRGPLFRQLSQCTLCGIR